MNHRPELCDAKASTTANRCPEKVTRWLEAIADAPVPPSSLQNPAESMPNHGPNPSQVRSSLSVPSFSTRTATSSQSPSVYSRNHVGDGFYRRFYLLPNRVHIRLPLDPLPSHIATLRDLVSRDRHSPPPSPTMVMQDAELARLGLNGGEDHLKGYVDGRFFPRQSASENLKRSNHEEMHRSTIPCSDRSHRISGPVPAMLYGYNGDVAFPNQKRKLTALGTALKANDAALLLPFLSVELVGEGDPRRNLWIATNQCLGTSAASINICRRFCSQVNRPESSEVARLAMSPVFPIAMSATEARLYVSWLDGGHNDDGDDLGGEERYYTQQIECFALQRAEHFIELRKYVRNILDWGRTQRLGDSRLALDFVPLPDRKRKRVAESPPPPPLLRRSARQRMIAARG